MSMFVCDIVFCNILRFFFIAVKNYKKSKNRDETIKCYCILEIKNNIYVN